MRLSNNLTFCLVSLILLFALECVYALTPVMANAPGGLATSNNPTTSTLSIVFPQPVCNVCKYIKDEFDMTSWFDKIINSTVFRITLIDGRALDLAKEMPNDIENW